MLWSTLWSKLGKQPLKITQHNQVVAVIDGKTIELDLKFDETGKPYLAPQAVKLRKPYKRVICYHAAREIPETLGSGARTIWRSTHKTEEEAWAAMRADGGNDLRRDVVTPEGKYASQWYDLVDKCWRDNHNDPLPY